MSKYTRRHIFVLILVAVISLTRVAIVVDPIYELVHTITLPLAETVELVRVDVIDEPDSVASTVAEQKVEIAREELRLPQDELNTTPADVVRRDVSGFGKKIWINKGSDSGIKANAAVLSNGFVVGKIEKALKTFSEVTLITDPMFRMSASVNVNNGLVTVQSGSVVYDLVPEGGLQGEIIYSDGIDGIFPPQLPVGLVANDISDTSGVFRKYNVELGQNPHSISHVQVQRVGSSQ